MEIREHREAGGIVLSIAGRMDAITTPTYEGKLHELIASGDTRVVIDFGSLDYISSAGLRALLTTAKALKAAAGEVRFARITGTVKDVFDISGFGSIFPIYPTVADALASFT
ncbi:STAS domain-containing protein [Trichlorobacter ammonificans]|uniref:Anti-sigma factor antagonist n=1 Tax=Trichlorobacter ammonificans TaxID=2916410 RepID=A0ABN8HGN0_9BACT|nr:STAS domain-containing protein [Trichlorobacter ammonificans]CAH2030337.1 Anti-sigma factor antagonist [Trichlorobacter ammonificans]